MSDITNILIITYYWPPAGGPGVQRWLGFVKHLPDFGFHPHVYVPENASYPILDKSLENELPKNYSLIKKKIWEPYQLAEWFFPKSKEYKKGNFAKNKSSLDDVLISIRGNFFIPDARKFWIKPSVRFLKKYIQENQIKTIVTSGPPHSLHLIGLEFKKQMPEVYWLADFRDPWTEISYHTHLNLSTWAKNKHIELEKKVLTTADVVIATSYSDAENYKQKGAKNTVTITNGFEKATPIHPSNRKKERFILSYVGGLEDLRNPSFLWYELNQILAENKEIKNKFTLQFVGTISQNILDEIKQKHTELYACVEKMAYLPHAEAVEKMQHADALLLVNFMDKKSKGIIPGKLFEYLATQNPILAIGPKESDVERILNETQAGQLFSVENGNEIKNHITQLFMDWKNGVEKKPIDVERFVRRELTKRLAAILT
jgi:hypothetical protein